MSWNPLTYQHGLPVLRNGYAAFSQEEDLSAQPVRVETKENKSALDNVRVLHPSPSLKAPQGGSFSTFSPLPTKNANNKNLNNRSSLEKQLEVKKEIDQLDSNEMNNQLLKSSAVGDFYKVGHLLQRKFKAKINPNIQDDLGETPLHKAAKNGHLQCMKFLLSNKANVYAQTKNGYTPMTFAIQSGNTAAVRFLLEARYDINYSKRPPLADVFRNFEKNDCACTKSPKEIDDSVRMARYLLRWNASILETPDVIFKPHKKDDATIMVPCKVAIRILLRAGCNAQVLEKIVDEQADKICAEKLMDSEVWRYFGIQHKLARAVNNQLTPKRGGDRRFKKV